MRPQKFQKNVTAQIAQGQTRKPSGPGLEISGIQSHFVSLPTEIAKENLP